MNNLRQIHRQTLSRYRRRQAPDRLPALIRRLFPRADRARRGSGLTAPHAMRQWHPSAGPSPTVRYRYFDPVGPLTLIALQGTLSYASQKGLPGPKGLSAMIEGVSCPGVGICPFEILLPGPNQKRPLAIERHVCLRGKGSSPIGRLNGAYSQRTRPLFLRDPEPRHAGRVLIGEAPPTGSNF